MNHGSQTIQQQGRIFEIGEETGSGEAQSGESEGGKRVKKDRFKICENCGETFLKKYSKQKRRFCQQACQHDFSVKRWLSCSKCLASIGIWCKKAAQILGVTGPSVTRGWQNHGIKADRPTNSSMVLEGRCITTKIRQAEKRKWKRYESAWMEEIKSHRAFPDWGDEWTREQQNKKAMDKYNSPENQYSRACNRDIWRHTLKSIYPDWSSVWSISRMSYTPQARAKANLRTRLKALMKTARRGGANVRSSFIGCSTAQLAKHLESGFTKRMTWENYGTYWHVDHILPCSSFDHTDERQVAQCWHWTNLRALEAKKNMDKSDTITEPQMQLMLCATH